MQALDLSWVSTVQQKSVQAGSLQCTNILLQSEFDYWVLTCTRGHLYLWLEAACKQVCRALWEGVLRSNDGIACECPRAVVHRVAVTDVAGGLAWGVPGLEGQ